LASGRRLVQGQSVRGADPFASTTHGDFWVNHTWLSDIILYELHELGDGMALVFAKSVLALALAALFFCFRRRGTPMGIFSLVAAAAMLALGPWLLLQPVCLSLLGVMLTLYLLERPCLLAESQAETARAARWLLVPLFALWANLDGWFLLGPVLVGLYALGEALRLFTPKPAGLRRPFAAENLPHEPLSPCTQGERGWGEGVGLQRDSLPLTPNPSPPSTGERGVYGTGAKDLRAFLLLTLVGVAACLLTPYHYHTFAWPPSLGLSHAEQALMHDPLGQTLVISPFAARFMASSVFASPGAWAYYILLIAGAVSFVFCGRTTHPGRLLVWLALAALSIYQARAIPFFAVAAGPILALNLQEWAFDRPLSETLRRLRIAARGVGVLAGLALLVFAWLGWLQPSPYQPRGWTVEPDGSLVRLAQQMQRWHEDGRFRSDRFALTFSPEVAHHLAWFCPAEKGFLDSRWPLFDRVADDYVRMRRCLLQPNDVESDGELNSLLDAHAIDRIIVHDPDWDRTTLAYRRLLRNATEWELLMEEGGVALFGRRTGASPSWKPIDFREAAYHPSPDSRAPLTAPRAPQLPGLFAPFYRSRQERSPDREEAALHLISFDLKAESMRANLETQWLAALASGLLGSGPGSEVGGAASTVALRLALIPLLPPARLTPRDDGLERRGVESFAAGFAARRDRGPSEALLLAVRAARRALSVNPDDAGALLLLGEAYLRLSTQTRQQGWQTELPTLAVLRRTQLLTALRQAVLLRPDLDQAHALLARLYYETGQWDRTLDHLRARLRIAEREVKSHDPQTSASAERRSALQPDVEKMDALVRQSLKTYEVNTAGKTDPSGVLDRARLALRHGLSRKALEMLQESDPAIFGKAGVEMQLDLMLRAGQAYEIRDSLGPVHERELGFSPYHSLLALTAAACGDYAAADAELDLLCDKLRYVRPAPNQLLPVRPATALRVARAVLTRPVLGEGPAGLAAVAYFEFKALQPLGGPAGMMRQEADWRVLRGVLALEAGAVEMAHRHLRAALDVWGGDNQAATGGGLDFPARPVAQEALRLLSER